MKEYRKVFILSLLIGIIVYLMSSAGFAALAGILSLIAFYLEKIARGEKLKKSEGW